MGHTTSKMKILRYIVFRIFNITVEQIQFNYSFTIFKIINNVFITRMLFNTIQVSKPLPLWACNCKWYSTIILLTVFRGSLFKFKQNSKAILTQLTTSNTIVSFLHLSISYGVTSRLYLPASSLNRCNEIHQYILNILF